MSAGEGLGVKPGQDPTWELTFPDLTRDILFFARAGEGLVVEVTLGSLLRYAPLHPV